MEEDKRDLTSPHTPAIFFIVSAPRSGSSMMAKVCDSGTNCTCEIEPLTNLVGEDPHELLEAIHERRLTCKTPIYGQKDPAYYAQISWLYEAFGCKFVYLIRDRIEVARSIYNWQRFFTGGIKADSLEDAGQICDKYNKEITKQLRNIPHEDYLTIYLNGHTVFPEIYIYSALHFLGITFDKAVVNTLYYNQINSPKERGFV